MTVFERCCKLLDKSADKVESEFKSEGRRYGSAEEYAAVLALSSSSEMALEHARLAFDILSGGGDRATRKRFAEYAAALGAVADAYTGERVFEELCRAEGEGSDGFGFKTFEAYTKALAGEVQACRQALDTAVGKALESEVVVLSTAVKGHGALSGKCSFAIGEKAIVIRNDEKRAGRVVPLNEIKEIRKCKVGLLNLDRGLEIVQTNPQAPVFELLFEPNSPLRDRCYAAVHELLESHRVSARGSVGANLVLIACNNIMRAHALETVSGSRPASLYVFSSAKSNVAVIEAIKANPRRTTAFAAAPGGAGARAGPLPALVRDKAYTDPEGGRLSRTKSMGKPAAAAPVAAAPAPAATRTAAPVVASSTKAKSPASSKAKGGASPSKGAAAAAAAAAGSGKGGPSAATRKALARMLRSVEPLLVLPAAFYRACQWTSVPLSVGGILVAVAVFLFDLAEWLPALALLAFAGQMGLTFAKVDAIPLNVPELEYWAGQLEKAEDFDSVVAAMETEFRAHTGTAVALATWTVKELSMALVGGLVLAALLQMILPARWSLLLFSLVCLAFTPAKEPVMGALPADVKGMIKKLE